MKKRNTERLTGSRRGKGNRQRAAAGLTALLLLVGTQPGYAGSGEETAAAGRICPACNSGSLTEKILFEREEGEREETCRHFAYGTDRVAAGYRHIRESCGICPYENEIEEWEPWAFRECHGYRSSEVTAELSGLSINEEALADSETLETVCEKCAAEKQITARLFSPICSGNNRRCEHDMAGWEEEVIVPASLTLLCPSCGAVDYVFVREYQCGWVCRGYDPDEA